MARYTASSASRIELKQHEEALKTIQKEELRLLQQQLYQLDPLLWLKERFGEDPADFKWSLRPEYFNHKWDGSIDPLSGMWESLAQRKWVGVEAGTGTAKTFSLARVVLWFLDCFPDSLVVTSAPKQDQLKLHLWAEISKVFYKFKRLRPSAKLYNLRLVVEEKEDDEFDPENPDLSKSWQAVGFVAGVASDESSATKAQGFHRKDMLIITEETPGMPSAVMTAFKNTSIAENNLILAVGNPDSQIDPLHQFCVLKTVKHYIISAYDFPNVVHKKEIIPGAVTTASIKRRLDEYGKGSSLFESRVRGRSPAQSTDSLIKKEWIDQCINSGLGYDGTYHAVGVDVAQSVDGDKAALAWGEGNILKAVQEFQCDNATHLAYNLFMDSSELESRSYRDYATHKLEDFDIMPGLIGVDTVGLGVAAFNALQDYNWSPVSLSGGQWEDVIPEEDYEDRQSLTGDFKEKTRKMYKFQGLRSQMYWELREDLRHGRINIQIADKTLLNAVIFELINIKFTPKENFIAVEPKENLKKRLGGKSPNKADAIVYWNWTRKGYRRMAGGLPIG